MEPRIIDLHDEEWLRRESESRLVRSDKKKCCIGVALCRSGLDETALLGYYQVSGLTSEEQAIARREIGWPGLDDDGNDIFENLYQINDIDIMEPTVRVELLNKEAERLNLPIRFRFVPAADGSSKESRSGMLVKEPCDCGEVHDDDEE